MSVTWHGAPPPTPVRITAAGWAILAARALIIALMVLIGLTLIGLVRLVERPLHRQARPWTPRIVRGFAIGLLGVLGIRRTVRGRPMRGAGAVVANHVSWLDIFSLYAAMPVTFVSKAEVAAWPVFGFLARIAGTLFIDRNGRRAGTHRDLLVDHLRNGHRIALFPEGTSTDGMRVLPFKTTLFAAFLNQDMPPALAVQPVTIRYTAPPGAEPAFYGWWGDMDFGSHALKVLSRWRQGAVTLVFHAPHAVADYPDRKALCAACEAEVRAGLAAAGAITG